IYIYVKCKWKNGWALKNYILTIYFSIFAYVMILVIALLIEPFSNYTGAILIGNGIGFITGSVHFMIMADKNCKKQEEKYCINKKKENVYAKSSIKETKTTQACPQNNSTENDDISTNIDADHFLPEHAYPLKLFVKPEKLDNTLKEMKVFVGRGAVSKYIKDENCIYISHEDNKTMKTFYDAILRTFQQALCVKYGILYSSTPVGKCDTQVSDSDLFDNIRDNQTQEDKKVEDKLGLFDDDDTKTDNIDYEVNNTQSMNNMIGQVVNEKSFAEMQKILPGFMPDFTYNKQKIEELKLKKQKYGNLLADEASKLIFPLIFGCFGYEIDLNEALNQTQLLYENVIKRKPKDCFVRESDLYMEWLREYAIPQMLFGTIYAYKFEYVKAAYHFMLGLKTEQVAINMPYCDFIKYILNKIPALATDEATYTGCGFSCDEPMGSISGTMLNAKLAMAIISEMEGCHGEVIIAKMGNSGMFGYLDRLGSTHGKKQPYPIDVYETYVIDKEYDVKKLRLYFYGYVNPYEKNIIKVADGFKIKSHSVLLNQFNFVTGA
ncbi:MAG: hypothetical protein LUI60_03035, partial [Clostridia bacterium]|nr:hypothetical protein [Clostridia bacterium]